MNIPVEQYNLIHRTLLDIVTPKGIEWSVIVSEINKVMSVDDWWKVRGVIGDLKDEGLITRTDSVVKEIYVKETK